ncbi:MAG: hypothetical protein IKO74_02675 [Selenomonadaceae bacterium]|nr:hypothetical protein [Selenomonadaceae bacterium]MBR4641530.1 hypothetical protein [Selenomonadaceae bacterium]MBR4641611.1 hypothetical protein [Selenomonadaceae bacterium]
MMTKSEKLFCTGASLFMLGFGLSTCANIADFLGGVFAGSAAIITFACWKN